MRPSSVRIFGRNYRIKFPRKDDIPEGILGLCSTFTQEIHIAPGQTPFEEVDTVLHEILHALCYTMKLELKNEEQVVSTLATGLVGVFQDNPKLCRYLLEKRK